MRGGCVAQLLCKGVVYLAFDEVEVVEAEVSLIYRLVLPEFCLHVMHLVLFAGRVQDQYLGTPLNPVYWNAQISLYYQFLVETETGLHFEVFDCERGDTLLLFGEDVIDQIEVFRAKDKFIEVSV